MNDNWGYSFSDANNDYQYSINISEKRKNNKKVIIIIALLLGIIVGYLLINKFLDYQKSYSSYENKLIKEAKNYVKKNSVYVSKEIYIDSSKLDVKLPNNCSLVSGVIYDGNTYTPYLLCNDYKSSILPDDNKVIQLIGDNVEFLIKGMEYIELGYESIQNVSIMVNVGNEEGIYNVYYVSNNNDIVIRKVIVLDNQNLKKYFPSIKVIGENIEMHIKGTQYEDAGAVAIDSVDGDISDKIIRIGSVDDNNVGEYKITYFIKNSYGMIDKAVRKVDVIKDATSINVVSTLSTNNMTNKDVYIINSINGSDYVKSILPSGEETIFKKYEYRVDKNGEYVFKIIDKDGNFIYHSVFVSNIDKTKPVGTCVANIFPYVTNVVVESNGDKEIGGYEYIINGISSGYGFSNQYISAQFNPDIVTVNIKDTIGNENTLTCSKKIVDPTIDNPKIKTYVYNNEEYIVANTLNELTTFEKNTCRRISQSVDTNNCDDACLSFSLYHAAYIQRGNLSTMNEYDACRYNYGHLASFAIVTGKTKEDAIRTVYNELMNGRVVVLQVTGNGDRNRRHFYLIVGYRKSKLRVEDIKEEDLLGIDSWDGCFATLSYFDTTKRTMFDNNDGYGYRVDIFK